MIENHSNDGTNPPKFPRNGFQQVFIRCGKYPYIHVNFGIAAHGYVPAKEVIEFGFHRKDYRLHPKKCARLPLQNGLFVIYRARKLLYVAENSLAAISFE